MTTAKQIAHRAAQALDAKKGQDIKLLPVSYTHLDVYKRQVQRITRRGGDAMHLKTEGLVLRQTNYQDHDLLLTVLTKDYGRMTLRARGVKGKRSKLKSGCQLLAYAEFTIFENRGFCTVQERCV